MLLCVIDGVRLRLAHTVVLAGLFEVAAGGLVPDDHAFRIHESWDGDGTRTLQFLDDGLHLLEVELPLVELRYDGHAGNLRDVALRVEQAEPLLGQAVRALDALAPPLAAVSADASAMR